MEEVVDLRVQRLREKTGCSFEKVKEALSVTEERDGSLLDALLYLENEGHAVIPENDGFYSTQGQEHRMVLSDLQEFSKEEDTPLKFRDVIHTIKEELFHNQLEVWVQDRCVGHMPVFFLLFLMPVTYGNIFPMICIPMFFGVSYRFSLSGSFLAEFNSIMFRVSKTLYDVGQKLFRPSSKTGEK